MGFYVKIEKLDETELAARYTFEGDNGCRGMLEFNKTSGDATLIEPMPGDGGLHFFNRATIKIVREWRKGHLPQILEWAS